jgi:SAM-dependent methyltransferase
MELAFAESPSRDAPYTGNPADLVLGALSLYSIDAGELTLLDRFEGVGHGYERKIVSVVSAPREKEAETYIATHTGVALRPLDWYKEHVLRGAGALQLPAAYIATIEVIAANVDADEACRAGRSVYPPLFPRGAAMSTATSIAEHWAKSDVYALIVDALNKAGKDLDNLSVEDLAPVDQFHARGLPATVELADALPVTPHDHLIDIGCGIGGPARYMAGRFQCRVSGIDITPPYVEAGNKLSALLRMQQQVRIELGDGERLPYANEQFDGGYSQHVTMNVSDRPKFYAEAFRVLKPGAFFALTEHGLGPIGNPHHPVPWSSDGSGEFLVAPDDTRALLQAAGFTGIVMQDTGPKYLAGYRKAIELAAKGELPILGIHLLLGKDAMEKTRNSARNIEEGRTHPIQVVCRKP